jgi:hypothetical protein
MANLIKLSGFQLVKCPKLRFLVNKEFEGLQIEIAVTKANVGTEKSK